MKENSGLERLCITAGMGSEKNKNKNSWYIHKQVNPDFELVQVFFGEHLIKENPEKPIAICESEKNSYFNECI